MMRILGLGVFYLLMLSLLLSSCVSNRQIQYAQLNDVNNIQPTDSIQRIYHSTYYPYKLKPQDQISVQFESLTEKEFDFLNSSQQSSTSSGTTSNPQLLGKIIDPDGNVSFPFIGSVKVSGKTLFEAQEHLQAVANQYLEKPVVKVRLLNFRVTFLGELIREGTVSIPNNQVSILEALGLAGGLTDFGNRAQVKIIRQDEDKTTVQYVNLLDETLVLSPYYFLHPGDVVIVPPLKKRAYLKYSQQNLTLLVTLLNLGLILVTISNL